jgi:hypothetical protein
MATVAGFGTGLAYLIHLEKKETVTNHIRSMQVMNSFLQTETLFFERNRILLALNSKSSMAVTLQIGCLHQFDYKRNDETDRDFSSLGFSLNYSENNHPPELLKLI